MLKKSGPLLVILARWCNARACRYRITQIQWSWGPPGSPHDACGLHSISNWMCLQFTHASLNTELSPWLYLWVLSLFYIQGLNYLFHKKMKTIRATNRGRNMAPVPHVDFLLVLLELHQSSNMSPPLKSPTVILLKLFLWLMMLFMSLLERSLTHKIPDTLRCNRENWEPFTILEQSRAWN